MSKALKCPKCGNKLTRDGRTPGGRQRWRCQGGGGRQFCYTTTTPGSKAQIKQDGSVVRRGKAPVFTRTLGKATERFIVTAAQNATPVHKGFMAALEQACKALNAELMVIPLRYKNPTSRWTESQANAEVWADEVQPYLWNTRKALGRNIVVLGDVKTQPTAVSPLTGFEAITHGESAILGHTKLQLRVIPTPQSKLPKILTTTGVCTKPNYTDSRAGKLGEFHHCLGAALVETRGKKFHLRQLNADKSDGSFIDLDRRYTADGIEDAGPAMALAMGDTHVDFIDPAVERATFGRGGIVETLKPSVLVYHDVLDAYSVNPHHGGNPFIAVAKRRTGKDDARAELQRALAFVLARRKTVLKSVIVPSNHNDFLRRWVVNTDWRNDPTNAEFYLETALAMVRGAKMTPNGVDYPNPFKHWADRHFEALPLYCLPPDESLVLGDVEYGLHGDRGPNGSRGSARNLRRIGVKTVIGHSHSPAIEEGCYQAGTSTRLRLEYSAGPSSWLQSHVCQYASGKRVVINIIEGEWRL